AKQTSTPAPTSVRIRDCAPFTPASIPHHGTVRRPLGAAAPSPRALLELELLGDRLARAVLDDLEGDRVRALLDRLLALERELDRARLDGRRPGRGDRLLLE